MNISKLEFSWRQELKEELKKKYIKNLQIFLRLERLNNIIYPKKQDIFKAFDLTHFNDVKVVILGQDPYHRENQANGLSFSVGLNVKIPPSLNNIYKEMKSDLLLPISKNGDLTSWAKQGVLLLNAVLSVQKEKPSSHKNQGWEIFTNKILQTISEKRDNIVFILWGKFAQEKLKFINTKKHCIISSPHPSPLSSYRGFFGSKPFLKTNEFLASKGIKAINWRL